MGKREHEGLVEVKEGGLEWKEVGQWVCECDRLSLEGSCSDQLENNPS